MLEAGVDRILSEVVDPKLTHIFWPQTQWAINEFLVAQKKRSRASAAPTPTQSPWAWKPGPASSIPGFPRTCLTHFGSSFEFMVKNWIQLLHSTSEWRQAKVLTDFSVQRWLWGVQTGEGASRAVGKWLCGPPHGAAIWPACPRGWHPADTTAILRNTTSPWGLSWK